MALAKEESVSKLIVNFSANSQKVAKAKQTKGYFLGRRKLLEDYWIKFNDTHDAISSIEVNDDNEEELKKVLSDERFAKIESAYCEALGELNDLIDELSTSAHETIVMSHSTPTRFVVSDGSNVKSILPKLQLPTFDGSFDEWLTFKDMFTSCVINDTLLSNVQRLHYLNCSLRGDAASVLKNIQVSDDNFNTAWDILQGRYDNKRKLIKQYLRDIIMLPTMTKESPEALRRVLDGITEAIRALKQLGRPTDKWDDWLILHVTEKLDPVIIKDWETSLNGPNAIPTYAELETFLVNRLQGLDAMAACSRKNQNEVIQKPTKTHPIHSHQANVNRCQSCGGRHVLMFCSDFRKQNPAQRLTFVTRAKLCKNCFKANHASQHCPSDYSCLRCHQKHHTMLHDSVQSQEVNVITNHMRTTGTSDIRLPPNSINESVNNKSLIKLEPVLLATAQIRVRSATGHHLKLRALLDSGSQATFISEYAVQQLRLQRTRHLVPVTGVGGSSVGKSTGVVDISVSSLTEPNFNISCKALILPRLGQLMPTLRIDTEPFCEFMDLDLADPNFHEPGSIDVILGADLYGSILHGEIMQTAVGAPVAQRTHLGWVIYGRLPDSVTRELATSYCAFSQIELANLVQCMWKFTENEDVESISKMTQDELYCEEFFKKTVQRTSSGRYVVKYPFKDSIDLTTLADSRGEAFKLFYYQLRRLDSNRTMKTMYQDFMSEYQQLGHMEPVFKDVSPQNLCYIPHHCVYKESSSTTKLRVVFNAARKYTSGKSLNDCLHVGPKLQSDLSAIILKGRTHRIGFMADIEKCYRQILVHRDDADMQRIIWTDNEGLPAIYRLLTVTYGLNCSPYLTIKVLHTLADDEGADFPQAAKVLRESFYMDDCLHGADSVETAQQLQMELQKLLQRGGFLLRKWNSNSSEFLQGLSSYEKLKDPCCELNLDLETKALGIFWFCQSDCIGYKVNVTRVSSAITKRQQLSDVAKIYDPTCLLAPIVITGKIMCQQLWLSGISWDDPLPEPHQQNWIRFREELPLIDDIKVSRWVFSSPDASTYQLHVFSDASLLMLPSPICESKHLMVKLKCLFSLPKLKWHL